MGRAVEALACFWRSTEKKIVLLSSSIALSNWSFPCSLLYNPLAVVKDQLSLDFKGSGYLRLDGLLVPF